MFAFYAAVTFCLSLVLFFPVVVLLSFGRNSSRRIHKFIIWWCRSWLRLTGMPVTISGPRPGKGSIVVANHVSYLDTMVIFPAINAYFKPLGKIEITRVPLLGYIYSKLVIPVDRSNRLSKARSMKLMQQELQGGNSIVVFPEGGFNETEAVLIPFHDGAFRLAITTGAPVVPLILPDTIQRWHYSAWYKLSPGINRAIFLPAVYPENGITLQELKLQVYKIMEKELLKYR